jgi:predicted flap endonuclease-1-like 5' DNA nuclease
MVAFSVRGRGFHARARRSVSACVSPTSTAKDLNALVRAAWFSRAPKRLAVSLAAAQAAAGSPGGDLPAGIGRLATQALLGVGVTTPEQVARHSRAELLPLHGVGPKAVRVLSEALEQRGLALRGRLGGG